MGRGGEGKGEGFQGIPEARREELQSQVLALVASSSVEPLTIEADAFERKFVHSVASDHNLQTACRGKGPNRCVVVSKPAAAAAATNSSERTMPYADVLQARLRPLPRGYQAFKPAEDVVDNVLVCRKKTPNRFLELPLGEGSVRHEEFIEKLPEVATIQAVMEKRKFVTSPDPEMHAVLYTKEQVFMHAFFSDDSEEDDDRTGDEEGHFLIPVGLFPSAPRWPAPPGACRAGGPRCDVWHAHVELPVRGPLQAHAERTYDRPIPRYQMIVDPNKFVSARDTWVPIEVDVAADGSAELVGGTWSHQFPALAAEAALPVFQAALPLLSKLRRPQLLLDDRRIQIVFKAQRIIVPPKQNQASESEYVGLWHQDGDVERVAAVVLYYYNVDPSLEGGDLEFCGREPLDILGFGDCSNNLTQFSGSELKSCLRADVDTQSCRVPVKSGTLVAFSNYQMVHRVLKMVNTSCAHEASRDFVALFVLDPAAPPVKPARCYMAEEYMWGQTISRCTVRGSTRGCRMPAALVLKILEFLGMASSEDARDSKRAKLLKKQLQPRGCFGSSGEAVYATGNGCYTLIGWLDRLLDEGSDSWHGRNEKGWERLSGLNLPPQNVGRGCSEALSQPSADLRQRLLEADSGSSSSSVRDR